MKLKRRGLVRIICFTVASVLVLSVFSVLYITKYKRLNLQVSNNYSMHLSELDESLYNISVALLKTRYASTVTQLSTLATELSTESVTAKSSLSQLPYNGEYLSATNKFLSQVGDYPLYLSKRVIDGHEISDSERKNLEALSVTADKISTAVNEVRQEYDKDGVWNEQIAGQIDQSAENGFSDSLNGLEELLVDFPSLIYDGPFSDHMLNGKMLLLENKSEITVDEAKELLADRFGYKIEKISVGDETKGNLPCYNFTVDGADISVTKKGGVILYMRKFRAIGEPNLSLEEAVSRAKAQLKLTAGVNFTDTYYFADEGVVTVNFAYMQGTTVCYSDLIKVGVALDNGEIVSVEAGGFIANHHERTVPTPKYTADAAKQVLSKELTVNDVRRVIIPSDGKHEKHCYEFQCTGVHKEQLLVYVNVDNLEEERILLLLKLDGGVLTK